MSHAILQFRYKLLRESLDWFDKIPVIMKLFLRMVRPGLGGMISFSLLLTGPLAPLAQARTEENKANYWTARKSVARQRSLPTQPVKAPFPNSPHLRGSEPVKETSKNWFEVASYTPVFGPRSWKRGNVLVPFVTIIQDAHDNYEAQLALSRTLAELADKEKDGPLLVCVEGAWGPLSTEIFKPLDPELRKQKADQLLKRHIITGEEFLSIVHPGLIQLVGVDDPDLHKKNTVARELVETHRWSTTERMKILQINMERLKKAVYPPRMRSIDEIRLKYQTGILNSQEFAKKIVPYASKEWWLKNFPLLYQLSSLDADGLEKSPTRAEIEEWVTTLSNTDLQNKIDWLLHQKKIDLPVLANEMEKAPDQLLRMDKRFQLLVELDQWISLADRLISLKMTPEDLNQFDRIEPSQSIEDVANKINIISRKNNVRVLPLPQARRPNEETTWQAAKSFYRIAKKRDNAMATNTLRQARKHDKRKVVLIAGGFHTPGISRLFRLQQNFNHSLCPKFSSSVTKAPRPTLRKKSLFQKSIPENKRKFRLSPTLTPFFRFIVFMSISSLALAAGGGTGSDWIEYLVLASTISDPFLRRLISRKPIATPPEEILINSDAAVGKLKNDFLAIYRSQKIPEAIKLLDEVSSYSDLRAYFLLSLLEKTEQQALLESMPPALKRRVLNGLPDYEYHAYIRGIEKTIQCISSLKEMDDLWKKIISDVREGSPNNKTVLSYLNAITEAKERVSIILNKLESQVASLKSIASDPGSIPKLIPPQETTDFILTRVNPALNTRTIAHGHLYSIFSHLEYAEKWLGTKLSPFGGMAAFGLGSSGYINRTPPAPTALESSVASLHLANGAKERLRDELYFLRHPEATYRTVHQDWVETISNATRQTKIKDLKALSPRSRDDDEMESERLKKIESFSHRMGNGVEDLSLKAQAFLETIEGPPWSLTQSHYLAELERVSGYFEGPVLDRRATVVLPNPSDIQLFASDLAVLYRHQGKAKKLVILDIGRIQTSHHDQSSIENFLTALLAEAKERGNVMILVDMEGVQGEGNRTYLHLMERWRVENDQSLAPDLIILSSERTFTFHLQQDALKKAAPTFTVTMKDPARLTTRRLDAFQERISAQLGIVLEHPLVEACVTRLSSSDRFGVVDRSIKLLTDLALRVQNERQPVTSPSLEDLSGSADLFSEETGELPLELRAVARLDVMPPDSQITVKKKLAELSNLRITDPNSERIADIERLIDTIISIPWIEMAPPIVSRDAPREIQDQQIEELYNRFEEKLRQSHTGLEENVVQALKDLLGLVILSDIGRVPPTTNIPTLVGPPGVGKTALMQLLGEVTGRPVYRISMNTIQDPMNLKGSSPTFLHAKEGRLVAELIGGEPRVGNPIYFLDELDKTPPAVQTVFLDVGQSYLRDNYAGMVFVGNSLFVATANHLENVIAPLRNRMDIIPMPGYTLRGKTNIATRNTLPRALAKNFLSDDPGNGHQEVAFNNRPAVLQFLAQGYAREEGMRHMIRLIDNILIEAYALYIKTGRPTLIDEKFVRSILGAPIEFLRIPKQDPVGRAYFPHPSGNLIDTHAIPKSTISPLAGRSAFLEMTLPVELLLNEHGPDWTKNICALFDGKRDSIAPISNLQIDVPRVVQEDAAAQLAMAIATLSKATGIPVKREMAFIGEMDNRARVVAATKLRQRILVAYDAGARWLAIPHGNKNELMTSLFPAMEAIRGPILEPPVNDGEEWTVYRPRQGNIPFVADKGPLESVLALAEGEISMAPSECIYVLVRTVEDGFSLAFAKLGRQSFKENPPSPIDIIPPQEKTKPAVSELTRPFEKFPELPTRVLEWNINVNGQLVDLRNLFRNGLTEEALSLIQNITQTIASTGSLDSIAQLEACARFSIAQNDGAAFVDFLLGLDPTTRCRIISVFSPETLGTLVHLKGASGYLTETARWEANLIKIQSTLASIKNNSVQRKDVIEIQDMLSVPGAFPPLFREGGSYYTIVGLRAAIDNYLYREGGIDDMKAHMEECLEIGISCLNKYRTVLSYNANPTGLLAVKNAMDQALTELAVFRPLFLSPDELGGQDPEGSWQVYMANEHLRQETLRGSCRFIPLEDLPASAGIDSPESNVWHALFGVPFERFVEVSNRDNHKVMVLTGCPPLLRNAWASYLNRNLWKVGLPQRIIKIDVSKLLESNYRSGESTESKWPRLKKTLEAARDSGNMVVWIDLDFLPPSAPPFLISRIMRLFNQGSGQASVIFTGEEFVHQNLVNSSPVYAGGVTHLSIGEENRENLLRLEIIEREKITKVQYPAPVVEHLCEKVRSGSVSLSLARRILDRAHSPSGEPLTPALIDSTQKGIDLENDQMLQWATLWEQFEFISGKMPKSARKRAMTLFGQFRKASGDEAAALENQIRIIIEFPWEKRAPSPIPRLPPNPQPEDYKNLESIIAGQINTVREELDRSHHGMDRVKELIINYVLRDSLARAHTGKGVGKPLLVVSHPGQGKTTLAESVARALGRPFIFIPLGAVKHTEELTGFASQYVNSDAGLLIKGMIRAGALNPVMLLDEIDKMGGGETSPIDSILSLTDPEQNEKFRDEYPQVDFPMDEPLYFATANDIEKLPGPVRDRFEIIVLPPYTQQEKSAILVDKALPELMEKWETNDRVTVTNAFPIAQIILSIVQEHGVRLAKAKMSTLILRSLIESHLTRTPIEITEAVARRLLRISEPPPSAEIVSARVGEINGLVYNEATGEGAVLGIHANLHNLGGDEPFRYVGIGRLGPSMKASLDRAVALAQVRAQTMIPSLNLNGKVLTVLVTKQDVQKDGDSAGVGFYFVALSALTGVPVSQDIALTGAISPSEGAMQVGAIEAKVSAAINAGVKYIFIPTENRDVVDGIVRSNGTNITLVEDLTETSFPFTLRIPRLLWSPGLELRAQANLESSVEQVGMAKNQISFEKGVAVIRCSASQLKDFSKSNKHYSEPPTLVLYPDANLIEDRVLTKNSPRGTDINMRDLRNGFITPQFSILLFFFTALAIGLPIGFEISHFIHWASTHIWYVISAVPVLILSFFTPIIISRIISRRIPPASGPLIEANGTIRFTDITAWEVMVDLNSLARKKADNEILRVIETAISQIEATRLLNTKDPIWNKLYPHLKHGPASYSRRNLIALLEQANPELSQIEIIPPNTDHVQSVISQFLNTQHARLIQT